MCEYSRTIIKMVGILLTDPTIGEGAEVAMETCCLSTPCSKSVSAMTREAITLMEGKDKLKNIRP